MRKLTTFLVILGFLGFGTAAADAEQIDIGYSWWHRASAEQQEFALSTAIQAIQTNFQLGYIQGHQDALEQVSRLQSGIPGISGDTLVGLETNLTPRSPRYGKSLKYYREAINAYYLNDRYSRGPFVSILRCLSDIEIAAGSGSTCAQMLKNAGILH